MRILGTLELIIILLASAAFIGAYILAFAKLLKSRISTYEKIVWSIVLVAFNLLGLVAFLIYHDYFLRKEFRTEL